MKKYIVLYLISTLVISCAQETPNESREQSTLTTVKPKKFHDHLCDKKNNNLNISILVDLSDRISYNNQIEKDTANLNTIANTFINHIAHKKSMTLEDRIQLFFEPNPKSGKINEIARQLSIVINKHSQKEQERDIKRIYNNLPIKLYNAALDDDTTNKGADLWGFFKNKVKEYCIEECHRNILIILTDGYLYYEGGIAQQNSKTTYINKKLLSRPEMKKANWKEIIRKKKMGILKATDNLQDLEVLVLGIDSHNYKNPYAKSILKHFWEDWFQEMGIEHYKIKNADIPNSIGKTIQKFIMDY